ncbi:MAG: aminotransferase class IV [Alphaproteobacteria bacterium GM7ARS4]|nr:aminotransferase class IV [Alphaproteobacteria bacterium GM7ARS4]
MSILYVQGRYVWRHQGQVSVFERGYQFADGVYEVLWVDKGRLRDKHAHYERLQHSMHALALHLPYPIKVLDLLCQQVIAKNRFQQGALYIQVGRGHRFSRTHVQEQDNGRLSVVIIPVYSPNPKSLPIKVVTRPDTRWRHCHIKSIALVKSVLSKHDAQRQGADEAWFVDEETGVVTEGASSNAWLIDKKGVVRTHPPDHRILHGVARHVTLSLCRQLGIPCEEKAFSKADIADARGAFATSTTLFIAPISHIDGVAIDTTQQGDVIQRLFQRYQEHITSDA